MSCGWSRKRAPPRYDEKMVLSRLTCDTSAWRVRHQKPPSPSSCQYTGASLRSWAKVSWGTASTKLLGSHRSTRSTGPPTAVGLLPFQHNDYYDGGQDERDAGTD